MTLKEKLDELREAGYVIFPEGYEHDDVPIYCYNFNIEYGKLYKCGVRKAYEEERHFLYVEGGFGDDEGWGIDGVCIEDEDDILKMITPTAAQVAAANAAKSLEYVIESAVKSYKEYLEDNDIHGNAKYSTNPATIIEWNSSHC